MQQLEEIVMDAVRTAVERPHVTASNEEDVVWYNDVQTREEEKRQRRRQLDLDRGPLTGAEKTFQRQIRWRAHHRPDLVAAMADTVAMTVLPGDHAADFSRWQRMPLVNIRFPRLVVTYRFAEGSDPYSGIAVVGYKVSVDREGKVHYGGPGNVEFAKNAAIKPHPKARGAAIDPVRDAVLLDTTLALDWAMENAVLDRLVVVPAFKFPPVLFGFPTSYTARPEFNEAMCARFLEAFTVGSPPLRAFVANQGGQVLAVNDLPNGLRQISMDVFGNLLHIRFPRWVVVPSYVKKGATIVPGTMLADLPRFPHPSKEELHAIVGKQINWVLLRLLEEATETVTVDDKVFCKESQRFVVEPRTWKCIPATLVAGQATRAVNKYLDLRGFLGRELPDQNDTLHTVLEYPADVKVQVLQLNGRSVSEAGLKQVGPYADWTADLTYLRPDFNWLSKQRDGVI
jgi:hypothetical protein